MAGEAVDTLNAARETILKKGTAVDIATEEHPVIGRLMQNELLASGTELQFMAEVPEPGSLDMYSGRAIPAGTEVPILKPAKLGWKKGSYKLTIDGDNDFINKG